MTHRSRSNFTPKWDGPYVVREVYSNSAYKIVDAKRSTNRTDIGRFLKHYYP